jgi:hypothetical protein
MRAPPMAGRATANSIELALLSGERPLRVALWLTRDGANQPERAVELGEFEAVATPVPHFRAKGELVADPSKTPSALNPPRLAPRSTGELALVGLESGASYHWRLEAVEEGGDGSQRSGAALARESFAGRFTTARPRGSSFTFDVFSDCHVFPAALEPQLPPEAATEAAYLAGAIDALQWYRKTRELVAFEALSCFERMEGEKPDFTVSLGDVFDLHGRGFNWAFDSQELADAAHLEARRVLGGLVGCGALYQVLGNWEGESGCHPQPQREFAIRARQRHAPNPRPDTTRFGGSADEDYFAWEWGDLLCVALDVRGHTKAPHHLGNDGAAEGKADDYTLGEEQKAFLERTLAGSDHLYKAIFIHHTVGGNGGNPDDSCYGRGGGRAAHVGEQAWVHDLMVKHGAQLFFYGHDHVFTHMEVEGVHYALPGTTSAPWRFSAAETGYTTFWPDSGYARVSVAPQKLHVEFVNVLGKVLHDFDVAPRPSTTAPPSSGGR